jgi:CHASE1-domain containing sensor protein
MRSIFLSLSGIVIVAIAILNLQLNSRNELSNVAIQNIEALSGEITVTVTCNTSSGSYCGTFVHASGQTTTYYYYNNNN